MILPFILANIDIANAKPPIANVTLSIDSVRLDNPPSVPVKLSKYVRTPIIAVKPTIRPVTASVACLSPSFGKLAIPISAIAKTPKAIAVSSILLGVLSPVPNIIPTRPFLANVPIKEPIPLTPLPNLSIASAVL